MEKFKITQSVFIVLALAGMLFAASVALSAGPPIHVGSHPNVPVVAQEGYPTCNATLSVPPGDWLTLISEDDTKSTEADFLETTRLVYNSDGTADPQYSDPYYSKKSDKRNAPSGPDSYTFRVKDPGEACEYTLYVENHCVHSADIWLGDNLILGPDVFKSTAKKVPEDDLESIDLTDHITKIPYKAYGCDDVTPCACETTCATKGGGCCNACYLMVIENLDDYGNLTDNFTVRVQSNPDSYLVLGLTKTCPGVSITKMCDGEDYWYVVENTGTTELTDCMVTDDLAYACGPFGLFVDGEHVCPSQYGGTAKDDVEGTVICDGGVTDSTSECVWI